ncbi:MAG: N-acetylmuramoyl-L-alanine amidase [Nitriliruptorales bacterium]|nr:N-acetylmuramoyl-L-alanine amidase [Nitriliruptorales bacterium]
MTTSPTHPRTAATTRLAVVLALVVGLLSATAFTSEAVTVPETLYHEQPVTAGVVEPGFPIDHVGVVFELPHDADHGHDHGADDLHEGTEGLAVRFRHDGVWGPWQQMIEDGAQAEGQWTGALVSGGDADAYQVRGVPAFALKARAAALNTTDGPERVIGFRPAGSADAVTTCKSRSDWGADESLRTDNRSYAPIQIMTVHHTATQNDDPDPDTRVRAIYEYHTQTNGWDDIGYQALISEDGTVYEGRWSGSDSPSCLNSGGTGWEFGHYGTAANAEMVTGAHTGGYNTGNYGVALLGTFTDVMPKQGARDALVEYLAELADRHGLDPEGTVDYDNGVNAKTTDTINGHRDFTSTKCPGGLLYEDLPNIRTDVTAAMSANRAPVVTITSPADADSYTVEETSAGAGATLTFAADATDEDATLGWQWTDAADATVATSASFEATLAVGEYTYTATATDTEGLSGSDSITVQVVEQGTTTTVDDVASGEQSVAGTVSGTYLDTVADDELAETLTEVEDGGRPSRRTSYLEHVWTVPVTGGDTVTLFVDASATSSDDGDDFAFAYSVDGGATYEPVLTVPAGGSGTYSASLDPATSGTVHVRVVDTNRTQGARTLDSIAVDHLFIRSESGATSAPEAPSTITLEASGYKVRGVHHVDLTWSGAGTVNVYRGETRVASDVSGSTYTDHIDAKGSGTYTHKVCEVDSSGAETGVCSNETTTTF